MTELIPRITAWLDQPQHIPPADQEAIKKLAQQYPYFVPLQHLEAVLSHKEEPFNESLLGSLRLKGGNYIMLQQLLATALLEAAEEPVPAPVQEISVQQVPTVQEVPVVADALPAGAGTEPENDMPLIQPAFTEDYFRHEGIAVDDEIPAELDHQPMHKLHDLHATTEKDKSLLVMMSFAEWLTHYKSKNQKEKEEEESRRSLRTMWQKEKLAAVMEEENEEIPEQVFEMAVNSIAHEDGLISESLATILVKQGKTDKAIDMYRKLSLRNPAKSTYFAQQIQQLQQSKS